MKRHPALVQLSRDHHFGLLAGWKIRQGITKNVDNERIEGFATSFFNERLKDHFAEEELEVFPLLDAENELVKTAKHQHRQLSALNDTGLQNTEKLQEFANLLEAHIRFEERQLFKEIQEKADPAVLDEIAARETDHPQDLPWQDEFWT